MEAFELRLWDGRIGRWLTIDPYHEFFSPYVGMGNNPISLIDPDGGSTGGPGDDPTDPPLFNYTLSEIVVVGSISKFKGNSIIIDDFDSFSNSYSNLSLAQIFPNMQNPVGEFLSENSMLVYSPDAIKKAERDMQAIQIMTFGAAFITEGVPLGLKGINSGGNQKGFNIPRVKFTSAAKGAPNGLSKNVSSQKQLRHLAGTAENAKNGGGFMNSVADAQSVLDAVHSGKATFLGTNKSGFPVYRFNGVTGTNVNTRYGITAQSSNVFIIKGTTSPSVVPTNPFWKP